MELLERFNIFVKKMQSTMGRIEKERFLNEISGDGEILEILKFLFNPYTVTGISDKKLERLRRGDLPLFDLVLKAGGAGDFITFMNHFRVNNTGRDEDVRLVLNYAKQSGGHDDLVFGIIKRDLKLGIQNTTLNKVFGADFVPKFDVMLAENYADNADFVAGKTFIITEKLDGVRCVLLMNENPTSVGGFFSRNGQPILDLVELQSQVLKLDPRYVYDGELLLKTDKKMKSDDLYRATVKITNADAPKRGLVFNIFDCVEKAEFLSGAGTTDCATRKARAQETIEKSKSPNLKYVPILYSGTDTAEILRLSAEFTNAGSEGIMLNIADAPYECKRTKNLLKVKTFSTADVLVVGVEEGIGANRGKLGAVIVKFIADGNEYTCRVGSGFKLAEREQFWQDKDLIMGKIIEIAYFELSRNQNDNNYSMRFPTFKWLRPDKTEISMN
jgi:DNA ligase-1